MLIYFFEDSTLACETETSSLSLSKESVCETIKLIPSVKWTQLVSSQAHSVKWPLACETQTSFFKSFKRFLGVKYGGENSSMQKVISGIHYWKATFNIWLHIKSPSYLIPFSSEGWNAQIMFPCCCSPFFLIRLSVRPSWKVAAMGVNDVGLTLKVKECVFLIMYAIKFDYQCRQESFKSCLLINCSSKEVCYPLLFISGGGRAENMFPLKVAKSFCSMNQWSRPFVGGNENKSWICNFLDYSYPLHFSLRGRSTKIIFFHSSFSFIQSIIPQIYWFIYPISIFLFISKINFSQVTPLTKTVQHRCLMS